MRKHAHAQSVSVQIQHRNAQGDFSMSIEDDGVGFISEDLEHKRTRHVGTAIMQERAQRVHATVRIDSVVGRGTRVELTLPGKEHITL